jgi:hypothetical protein
VVAKRCWRRAVPISVRFLNSIPCNGEIAAADVACCCPRGVLVRRCGDGIGAPDRGRRAVEVDLGAAHDPERFVLLATKLYTDVYSWAKTRGAVDVGQSHRRLLLQNSGSDRITIRSISAKVIERLSPIAVTYVQAPSAGTNDLVDLGFNLDSGDVVAAQPEKTGPAGSQADTSNLPFFSTKDVTLDPGESTDIKITARTAHCHCTYDFEVQVVKPNSTDTLEISDVNGRPLAITAPAEQYQNRYEDGQLACQSYSLFHMSGAMADCSRPA